jgi:hypothetical protein
MTVLGLLTLYGKWNLTGKRKLLPVPLQQSKPRMTKSETSKLVTLSELSFILLTRGSDCENQRKLRVISTNFTALAPQGTNLPVWSGLNDFHTAARYEFLQKL